MCWLLNFAIPILREVVVGRDQLVDALHELLGLTGNFECDRRQCLSPHAPLTAALALAFGVQDIATLACFHESLLAVDEASDQVAIAGCLRFGNDLAHGVDDGADQRVELINIGSAADGAYEALDGLNQAGGLVIKINLFNKNESTPSCYHRTQVRGQFTLRSSVLLSTWFIPYPFAIDE